MESARSWLTPAAEPPVVCDELSNAEAHRIALEGWAGDLTTTANSLAAGPQGSVRLKVLKAQAAFLRAGLTGDKEDATSTVQACQEAIRACKEVEAPVGWGSWAASFVVSLEPQSAPAREAAALRALSEMYLAVALGMQQQWMLAPMALRRALAGFGKLPEEEGTSDAAAPPPAIRSLGLGVLAMLLALLPRPIAGLLTLGVGSLSSLFGPAGPTEAVGEALLSRAASCAVGPSQCWDGSAAWLAQVVLLLFSAGKPGAVAPPDEHDGGAAAASAPPNPVTPPDEHDGGAAAASAPPNPVHRRLAALDEALPGSLVVAWLGGSVLRKVGMLGEASARLEYVLRRSAELELGFVLHRVCFNVAQVRYACLAYGEAAAALAPLLEPSCAYTAKGMCALHRAAALAALGEAEAARECMRMVQRVAEAGGGRLDRQLALRAQGWLARSEADLPLCSLEVRRDRGLHQSLGEV